MSIYNFITIYFNFLADSFLLTAFHSTHTFQNAYNLITAISTPSHIIYTFGRYLLYSEAINYYNICDLLYTSLAFSFSSPTFTVSQIIPTVSIRLRLKYQASFCPFYTAQVRLSLTYLTWLMQQFHLCLNDLMHVPHPSPSL